MQPLTLLEVVLSNTNLCLTVAGQNGHLPKVANNCEAGNVGCKNCPFLGDKLLTELHPVHINTKVQLCPEVAPTKMSV